MSNRHGVFPEGMQLETIGHFDISNGDAIDWLASISSASFDLLITDPPYESLEKHRAVGTTTRLKHSKASSNDWFRIFPNDRFEELFEQIFRVLRKNSHFYLFCDSETMFIAKPIAERVGFKFWKPIIWDKMRIGMGYHYRARYENILFFEKGKRRLNDLGIPDVLGVPRIHKGYPTEKPVGLCEILVRQSSSAGEIVADPFFGSGAVGVAAIQLGRSFRGNDINPDACGLAAGRMLAVGGQLSGSKQIESASETLIVQVPNTVAVPSGRLFAAHGQHSDGKQVETGSKVKLSQVPNPFLLPSIETPLPGLEGALSTKECPSCSRREGKVVMRPVEDFGTRVMRNGARKFQSYCKACR